MLMNLGRGVAGTGRGTLAGQGGGREPIEEGELSEYIRDKHEVVGEHTLINKMKLPLEWKYDVNTCGVLSEDQSMSTIVGAGVAVSLCRTGSQLRLGD